MVSTDEIRQRIEQADQARLRARVEAAENVATLVVERAQARTNLAGLEATAAAAIDAAGAVMTVDELAKFTGIPITELRVNGKAKAVPVRKARTVRAPKVRPAAPAVEPQSVTVPADAVEVPVQE